MNKRKLRIFSILLFFITIFAIGSNNTNVKAAGSSGDYSLKVGGSNTDNLNIDGGNYYITGNPGQSVDLKLMVINSANRTRQFKFNVTTAYTTDSGAIGYNKLKVTDPSLKIQTRSLATPKKAVFSVPGNKTATLTFKMKVPEKKFNGTLMGGVSVAPYKEKAKGTVSKNGTLIKNRFSYSIPIQIRQSGNKSVEPKYSIRSVKPALTNTSNGKNQGVKANIHNSTNSYAGTLKAHAVITKKGDKDFKITEDSQADIVPTTNFNMGISWGKKSLQSGDYHLKLTYKTEGGIKSWVLNKDFTITNNDAAKYNKLAGIKPNYLWLYILLAILALAIILGLGIYLGKRNNNKNNNGNNNSGNNTRRRRR
ncbi:DUF3324 domain-containing protein [Companilactobacillus halodurans]|uniref:DUF3324 domain-containing protein n=1 Tax=Companilactobacillus halodurans TaxID=2584183 RepID=A0A5P0ZUQ7_9LACO|nr:DUF3324 domain-containing protein [Companilactobacillus halodurans]MQS76307.1 DUF3324 domain-containing protein [Companilactobacillus halodurans]MQS96562.1 DUF3324 domain-containing protein [Companilactobacillus halodurans]